MEEHRRKTSGQTLEFLSGGGDAGRRLRAHDWSATSLGRPETWPLSLQTSVKLLLAAPSPIAVVWGPDLHTLHNDAFASVVHDVRRPHDVGLPFRQLSPEIWQRVAPLLERSLEHRESALLEDQLFCMYRNGFAEEMYLSFSCNSLSDDAASARGVMLMVTDATDRVISARRTAALRDVSASGGGARSVDDACLRALGALSRHSTDIPFALVYVACDVEQRQARIAATAALPSGGPATPPLLSLGDAVDTASWPVGVALRENPPRARRCQGRSPPREARVNPLPLRRSRRGPSPPRARSHDSCAR